MGIKPHRKTLNRPRHDEGSHPGQGILFLAGTPLTDPTLSRQSRGRKTPAVIHKQEMLFSELFRRTSLRVNPAQAEADRATAPNRWRDKAGQEVLS